MATKLLPVLKSVIPRVGPDGRPTKQLVEWEQRDRTSLEALFNEAATWAGQNDGTTTATVTVPHLGTGFIEVFAMFKGSATVFTATDTFEIRVFEDGIALEAYPVVQAQNGTAVRYGVTSTTLIRRPAAGNRTYIVALNRLTGTTVSLSGVRLIAKAFWK